MQDMLPIVTYQNCRDNTPRQSYRRWDNLSAGLTRHTARSDKDGPAWSPAEYVPDRPRGNANVQSVSCYVADIDDGTPAAALWDGWRTPDGRPLAWCLHSSYSSTPEQPKYRVVFPLKAPVPAADWPAVHRKLTLALVGDHADPSCKDAARLYFLPSCPPGALETAFADAHEGEPLDPADFPDPEPEAVAEAQMRRAFRGGPPRPVGEGGASGGKPGSDFNERGAALGLLLSHGWQEAGGRSGLTLLRRPGKTHDHSATFGYGGNPIFHCFTSSAPPFEANKTYSPFAVYAFLEHGGDFTAAARQLAKEGYGEPPRPAERPSVSTGNTNTAATAPVAAPEQPPATPTVIETISPPACAWPTPDPALFHGLLGEFVRAVEPHTEADPVAIALSVLVGFGVAIGRSAYCQVGATRHHGNLYGVVCGDTASGKGTSWGLASVLLRGADMAWRDRRVLTGLSSGEGLINAVRDPLVKKEVVREKGKIVDYQEVVADEGEADKRLLVVETEFSKTLKVCERERNTLSPIMRQGWDGDPLRVMTKEARSATDAHIGILGHITPTELRRDLTQTDAANGFGNRFLWLCARRSKLLPEGGELNTVDMEGFKQRLAAAVEFGKQAEEIRRDADARAVWGAVYPTLTAVAPGLLGCMTARAAPITLRLSMLYALLEGSRTIRREHLTAALALWEYAKDSVRHLFGDALGDAIADELLRALRGSANGLTRSEIGNLFGRNQSSGRIGQALALLHGLGHVRGEKQTTGGRTAERWFAA